ncbi:MAG: hypothetical protein Q7R50_00700 [Dehalococcoidales bacterium]|nr:hypothetical protein [Dehalococcoidales bacterium]
MVKKRQFLIGTIIVFLAVGYIGFILSLPAAALAAENGVIQGRLVNGTENGSSVANQNITLKTYLSDASVGLTTTKTDAECNFVFADLVTDPHYNYEATVTFQEASYSGERLTFSEVETTKSAEIAVYDSTASDDAIAVVMEHVYIYVGQDSLKIKEIYLISNESDRTYIGSKEVPTRVWKETLRFSLPKGATALQYGGELTEASVVPGEEGFIYTMPVLPTAAGEEKLITISYNVSYNGGEYTYSQRVNYPMDGFFIFVQGDSSVVASDQLLPGGLVEFEGTQFNYLYGGALVPGDTLVAHSSNLSGRAKQSIVLWVLLGLAALVVGFIYLLRKKKRAQPSSS